MQTDLVTVEDLQKALPATLKTAATQSLADKINMIAADPLEAQAIRENFIGYSHVLRDGKFKMEDYLNAVRYVSYKLMGLTNKDAYERTFPDRMNHFIATGADQKTIAAYVSIYNKGKLVNLIYEQTMIPTWVLNQDAYQKAIKVQMELMSTSGSDLVRTQAANSLLTHLKKPEVKEFQISLEQKENSGMKELMKTMEDLAHQQLKMIRDGASTRDIAALPLSFEAEDAEFTEVTDAT